ncbi:hypothetical protein [Kribbella sp. NBC_00359]|uniref:hypothetical protein n=1 Tax=Kribbella sp. NBC_00359 TaxID=2975966 RepID=UPI002E1A8E59
MDERHGHDERPEWTRAERSAAWDRIGWLLEDMGAVGQTIGKRSLNTWASASQRLKQDKYAADEMSADLLSAFVTALENASDAWSLVAGIPERLNVAVGIPTAFALLTRAATGDTFGLAPPVTIRGPARSGDDLPEQAEIALRGPSKDAADQLLSVLVVRRDGASYVLESSDAPTDLTVGLYQGLIYFVHLDRPLAHLDVVVVDHKPSK